MIVKTVRPFLFACLCLLSASCSEKKSMPADSDVFQPSWRLAELREKALEEVSGLAASVANPGLLWTVNDSGNPAIVFLVDEDLTIRLACRLRGVKNRDWEDVAVGPGPDPGKRYVYVADIGDNGAKREFKYIYRFEEPVANRPASEIVIKDFDTIVVRLADGKKDTETMMVHPKTKDIYLVSKRERPVVVYRLHNPSVARDTLTAVPVVSVPLTQIVAGAFSPDGEEIVLKNYDNIYYWKLDGKPLPEVLKTRPSILHYTEEPQGESIAFNVDGSGFYTLSEQIKGERTYLYFYPRKGVDTEKANTPFTGDR